MTPTSQISHTKRLKQWFKRTLRSEQHPDSSGTGDALLPLRDDWFILKTPAEDTATKDSRFFHLPVEIRQKILIHAFGDQVVHIDLTFDHPLARSPCSSIRPGLRNPRSAPTQNAGPSFVRDESKPKGWQWFGCVCVRRFASLRKEGQLSRRERMEPCEDRCIPGDRVGKRVQQLESHPLDPMCCNIGVMGWLLACRQAYIEGTDVLYRTNTFHIASLPLLLHLPHLLPPHHLRTVTSLELLLCFNTPNLLSDSTMAATWEAAAQPGASIPPSTSTPPHHLSDRNNNPFLNLCATLPNTFPNVRHLYVALQAHIVPPHPIAAAPTEEAITAVERVILAPVEGMFCRLLEINVDGEAGTDGADQMVGGVRKREFNLAIQRGGWQVFAEVLPTRDERVRLVREEFADGSCWERLWKPLYGEVEVEGAGYWLRPGWDDFEVFGREYWMFDLWGTGGFKGEF